MVLFNRRTVLIAVPAVLAVTLAACGESSSTDETKSAGSSAPLFEELPKEIQDSGKIKVGSSIDYPPFEYYEADGKTLAGFEPELAGLLEKQLGVSFEWNNAAFDTLFSALRANRYDVVYGATNDTEDREKLFDFVYYLKSSQGFVAKKGNANIFKTEDDLCGHSIAAVRGGVQAQYLEKRAADCEKEGKGKLEILTFAGNADEQLAVKNGKADAMLENYPTAVTFAKESDGELELVPGLQVEERFFGMVLKKDSTELRDALVKAWNAIIEDGSYQEVLDKWELGDIAVKEAGVNAVESGAQP